MHPLAHALYLATAYARIAQIIPRIPDPLQSPVKGELISKMLPRVHLLTLVSILDEALEEQIDAQDIPWPEKTKRDLFNRINVVSSYTQELNREALHEIRLIRNAVAHGVEINESTPVTWDYLDTAIDLAMQTFSVLGLHEHAPSIVAYAQRTPTLYPESLGPNGERIRQSHRVGARMDEEVLLEYGIEVTYFPPTDA